MAKRKIIKINEEKCNGCGDCIPNCPEGALKVIDGKARLISDLFCDGLGVCLGHCPYGAIEIEEREAEPYSERKVMENIVKQGKNVIKEHLSHLKDHNETRLMDEAVNYLKESGIDVPDLEGHDHRHYGAACPGLKTMKIDRQKGAERQKTEKGISRLGQWPVQITLVPPHAPYLQGADLLIAADCVPFAYADFHEDFLKNRVLLIGCPKLDDADFYKEKIAQILSDNEIRSITCVHMEVPCCFGLIGIIKDSIKKSGKDVPLKEITIGIDGQIR